VIVARIGTMNLESRLPPLNVAWLYCNTPCSAAGIEELLCTHLANNPYYLDDVVTIAAQARHKTTTDAYIMPSPVTHVYEMSNADLNRLAYRVLHCAYNRDVTSMYVFACRVNVPPLMKCVDKSACAVKTIEAIVNGFALDCKFKTTNDLFIHTIIMLKLPAWLTAGMCIGETPYVNAARVFGPGTNHVIRPLVQTKVETLLDTLVPHEQFAILAAVAIELTNLPVRIVSNTAVLTVPFCTPTLAILHNIWESDEARIGYMHKGEFHESKDPFAVIAAWSIASDASSAFSKAAAGDSMFENPLRKYMD